jgi:Zn-dependent peptidase ImmA (M78 family)
MKKPFVFRTHNKARYELFLKKPPKRYQAEGICYDPIEDNPKILVNPNQTEKRVMNTIIHEIAHAFFWDASEGNVAKFANTVARLLYKEGWKKEDKIAHAAKSKKGRKSRGRKKK